MSSDRLVDKYNTLTNDEKSLWQQVQGQFVKNAGYWDFVTLNDVTYSSLDDQIDYNGIDTATVPSTLFIQLRCGQIQMWLSSCRSTSGD